MKTYSWLSRIADILLQAGNVELKWIWRLLFLGEQRHGNRAAPYLVSWAIDFHINPQNRGYCFPLECYVRIPPTHNSVKMVPPSDCNNSSFICWSNLRDWKSHSPFRCSLQDRVLMFSFRLKYGGFSLPFSSIYRICARRVDWIFPAEMLTNQNHLPYYRELSNETAVRSAAIYISFSQVSF